MMISGCASASMGAKSQPVMAAAKPAPAKAQAPAAQMLSSAGGRVNMLA